MVLGCRWYWLTSLLIIAASTTASCTAPYLNCTGPPLQGASLRVHFITDDWYLKQSGIASGISVDCVANECTGIVLELYEDFRDSTGFNAVTTSLSASAMAVHNATGSIFTACAHDVGVGNLDLCVSNFWETEERSLMGDFSSPFEMQMFRLWANKQETRTLTTMFAPFSSAVWLTLVIIFVMLKVSIFLIEYPAAKFRMNWRERNEAMLEKGEIASHEAAAKAKAKAAKALLQAEGAANDATGGATGVGPTSVGLRRPSVITKAAHTWMLKMRIHMQRKENSVTHKLYKHADIWGEREKVRRLHTN
jgi:hypothetical protein